MKMHRTPWHATLLAGLALGATTLSASARTDQDAIAASSVDERADLLWTAAMDGRLDVIERYVQTLEDASTATVFADRAEATLAQIHLNREKTNTARMEARAEAFGEMVEHREAEELVLALESAITVQSRSASLTDIFENDDINALIADAKATLPDILDENDWLQARDVLFRLRTLYEDTDRYDQYKAFNEELERVNKRVALLAQYAPRRLHDLRAERAERRGEEPIADFNPAAAQDWKERLDGVDKNILRNALLKSAMDHVEQIGWRPMIEGGLESMYVLATTPELAETFPNLGDPQLVDRWVQVVRRLERRVGNLRDREINVLVLEAMITELLEANDDTLELPQEVIFREFGDGGIHHLDRYTEIIWPDAIRRFRQATNGNFVGVGILIRHNEARDIVVVNPLEGAPAYFAGVKPEDLIVEVDGESTVGWTLNDAVDRITGRRGTAVTLGIKRDGVEGIMPITVERDTIKIRSVKGWYKERLDDDGVPEWDWYIDDDSRIAYLRLTQFTDDTYGDLLTAWRQISADGRPRGIILDLRFNPGGLLTSAIDIANLFIRNGVIVTGEDKFGMPALGEHRARPDLARMFGVPTVVLVNRGSASASEIVSGCLQAHNAAVIVGDRTFGKGSVQTVHRMPSGASLKLTTHYYRLPSPDGGVTPGRFVHRRQHATLEDQWGVVPDIQVNMSDDQVRQAIELRQEADLIPENEDGELDPKSPDRPDVTRLLTEGLDPQLETALLLLQAHATAVAVDQEERVTMRP